MKNVDLNHQCIVVQPTRISFQVSMSHTCIMLDIQQLMRHLIQELIIEFLSSLANFDELLIRALMRAQRVLATWWGWQLNHKVIADLTSIWEKRKHKENFWIRKIGFWPSHACTEWNIFIIDIQSQSTWFSFSPERKKKMFIYIRRYFSHSHAVLNLYSEKKILHSKQLATCDVKRSHNSFGWRCWIC